MSDSIKWLHISDFHFGLYPFDQAFSAKKIVEHLKEAQAKGLTPDFIFITGDVANTGKKSEYEQFVENLISPIVDLFGSAFLDNIFTVPGNHDLNRHVNEEFSKEKFVRPESRSFNPDQGSALRREMLAKRFEDFFEHNLCESSTDIKSDRGAVVVGRWRGALVHAAVPQPRRGGGAQHAHQPVPHGAFGADRAAVESRRLRPLLRRPHCRRYRCAGA